MVHAKPEGPVQGFARCGLDIPYAEKREAARREIEKTQAGRNRYGVPHGDMDMKNPDGGLSAPSAMPKH